MTQSKKRLFILLGLAAGLLLVAVVLPKVLFAGDSGDEVDPLAAPIVPATASTATPSGPVKATPTAEPVETFEVFTTKNPFTPLVATAPATAETDSTPAATPGAIDTAPVATAPPPAPVFPTPVFVPVPTFPTAPSFPAPAPAPAPAPKPTTTTTLPPSQPRTQQRIKLLNVFTATNGATRASVRINDTVYDVAGGDRFATSFQVVELSIDQHCGEFLFGDDRFRICEGEELLK